MALVSDSWGSTATTTTTTIEVNNGGKWGGWQEVKMCPHDFYAYGFSLRVRLFFRLSVWTTGSDLFSRPSTPKKKKYFSTLGLFLNYKESQLLFGTKMTSVATVLRKTRESIYLI